MHSGEGAEGDAEVGVVRYFGAVADSDAVPGVLADPAAIAERDAAAGLVAHVHVGSIDHGIIADGDAPIAIAYDASITADGNRLISIDVNHCSPAYSDAGGAIGSAATRFVRSEPCAKQARLNAVGGAQTMHLHDLIEVLFFFLFHCGSQCCGRVDKEGYE
ncbi:hypothetical protein D9M71_349880 [compost metagenome]